MSNKKFITRFSEKSAQIGRKALLLRNVSIVISAVIVLAFIADFIDHDYVNAAAECVGLILFAIGFFVLHAGKYKEASFCCVGAAFVLMLAMSFVCSAPTKYLLFRNSAYFFLSSSLCALFIENVLTGIILGSINIVSMVIFSIFLMPASGVPIAESVATLATAELVYILGTFFLIKITQLNNIYTKEIDKDASEKSSQITMLTDVITSTSYTMDSLSQLHENIQDVDGLINNSVQEINIIGDKINKIDNDAIKSMEAVSEINIELGELSSLIQEQDFANKDSANATNQMIVSIQSVANNAKNEKSTMDELANTSKEGENKLLTLLKNINSIQDSIGFIEKIVGMINSISSKTNLLAMNAAIEASHAGVAGKGFAVVADEIRKLADDTNKKANEIAFQINSIHEVIGNVVLDGERTRTVFNEIQAAISKSTIAYEQISLATDELTNGGQKVLDSFSTITKISERITQCNKQITGAQALVTHMAENISVSLTELASDSKNIISLNKKVYNSITPIDKLSQNGADQAVKIKSTINRIIM